MVASSTTWRGAGSAPAHHPPGLDPLLLGSYPVELQDIFGDTFPEVVAADTDMIRQPIDFLGINFYKRGVTRHDPTAWPVYASLVPQPQHMMTTLGPDWEVYPPALTRTLLQVRERYGDIPLAGGGHFTLVDDDGNNVFHDPDGIAQLSDKGRHFLGGLLDHFGALMCIGNPTVNSYCRMWDEGFWAPVYRNWGWQNRKFGLQRMSGIHTIFGFGGSGLRSLPEPFFFPPDFSG